MLTHLSTLKLQCLLLCTVLPFLHVTVQFSVFVVFDVFNCIMSDIILQV